ncbi:MAG: sigma-70 family RNA polymerase sigma factor [Planctomycetales bacterium]|nr:sigma-70 family RNA polymerase sigma factor [bacterium]UNM08453.1 MAG: sigma-70 family RNA polymerase sigma factor [Planctomycetales bacterium]
MHELIDRCRGGDREAFSELVVQLHPWALRYCASMLPDESLARDAVQESMVLLFQRIGQLRSNDALLPWLRSILRSQVLRIARRPAAADLSGAEAASSDADAQRELELAALRQSVQRAVASLSEANREAVELFYMEERSVAEVSLQLGIPQGTVKRRLHDSRRLLRELLPREGIKRGSALHGDDEERINL